jgi:plasmid stabilization system protein ParE
MTPGNFELHPQALQEAIAARDWYRVRSERAASAFLNELAHALEQVRTHPERWPRAEDGTRRVLLHRFPFAVVYRLTQAGVLVIAVAHGRRRPGYWRDRSP